MKLESIQAAEAKLLLSTYERNPILFTGGEGVYLIDEKGEKYLDLLSGIGVNALGYGHPAILKAIQEQSQKLIHTSNLFFHEGQAELAARLTEMTGLDRVFFSNSGTEAWEAAMKVARAYAGLRRSEGHNIGTKFLAMDNGFHGRTFGSVSTTYKAKYREPFGPVVPGVEFVRYNDIEDLKAKFSSDVCAVMLEAIQGEGGVCPVDPEFVAVARQLTKEAGSLLIIDEIQAGLGRTGKWCAYQHFNVLPDITTLAKPLAGGIPMGAMLCTEEAARAIHPGMHGTTFGGNVLACAVAIAVIDTIKNEGILDHVTEVGNYFQQRLKDLAKKHDSVKSVRGYGLMVAAELESAELAKIALTGMMERHIVINRTSDTVLRFLPPYILGKNHVDDTVNALDEILSSAAATQIAGSATQGGKHVG